MRAAGSGADRDITLFDGKPDGITVVDRTGRSSSSRHLRRGGRGPGPVPQDVQSMVAVPYRCLKDQVASALRPFTETR
jgi:hypothetical protein